MPSGEQMVGAKSRAGGGLQRIPEYPDGADLLRAAGNDLRETTEGD